MKSLFINDGYTATANFKGRGFIPSVTIKFRPLLAEQVVDYFATRDARASGKVSTRLRCEMILAQLESWGTLEGGVFKVLTEANGDPIVPTLDKLARVPASVLTWMQDEICGFGEEDADAKN